MLFFNVNYFFLCINQFVFHADQSLKLELRLADRWIRSESTTCAQFSTTSGIGSDRFAQLVEQLQLAPGGARGAEDLQIRGAWRIRLELPRLGEILSSNPIITHYPLALLCIFPVWLCGSNIINSYHQLPE